MSSKHVTSESILSTDDKSAFISYYNQHSIIPVSQDTDSPDFTFKRNSLYKLLGIPLTIFKGRTVLEFGPGGGYNALAIIRHNPSLYVFVDASTASLDEIQNKFDNNLFGQTPIEITNCNIFDYKDDRKFDFVIIEGTVPGQNQPRVMLAHSASFVSVDGFLTTTTTTATSLVSEVCRRLFLPFFNARHDIFETRVLAAANLFESHLGTLETSTRPPRDWVLDSIFHPWPKRDKMCFSILDAIDALGDNFEFYGSSPTFLVDDRFYKKIGPRSASTNDLAKQQFSKLFRGMIDYRVPLLCELISRTDDLECEALCQELYDEHFLLLRDDNYNRIDKFMTKLATLSKLLPEDYNCTKRAIEDFIENFPKLLDGAEIPNFAEFSKWWGRGQQYASFIRSR
jgi:hypothetical protein